MNETNALPTAIPYIEYAVKLNNTLVGLPGLLVVCIGCLAFGYLLKALPVYPNRWIPFGVFVVGICGNLAVTPLAGAAETVRAVFFGALAGAVSIFVHRRYLAKYDHEFKTSSDTEIKTKANE